MGLPVDGPLQISLAETMAAMPATLSAAAAAETAARSAQGVDDEELVQRVVDAIHVLDAAAGDEAAGQPPRPDAEATFAGCWAAWFERQILDGVPA
jgi:hypothetical protein